jgi:hypothetical protein
MNTQMIRRTAACAAALSGLMMLSQAAVAQAPAPATPKELVATYDALADAILGANKAERKLVLSILATSYGHAQGEVAHAKAALKAGDAAGAKAAIDNVAAAVGQIATEGDNAVAGVRKRLLEGGHHANSEGEAQGVYEAGYVVVNKAAKKAFLDSSQAIAMLGKAPAADKLDAEWKKVEAAWSQYVASAK